ncbi:hypothetical protein [Luteococcus sp.]|uniref:hypothetical protein n=1 Tax=Luteococcus sp. TaxID=1969402 RepID=UPI00373687E8
MHQPLNTFESRLLDHLQGQITAQPGPAAAPRRPAVARFGLAVAACVTMVAGALGLTHLAAQPAWAVDPHPDGTVTITVNRPEGAAELQQRLEALGISADIQFPPEGQRCRPGRITDANTASVAESEVIRGATMSSRQVTVVVDPSRMTANTTLMLEVSALDHISDTLSGGSVGTIGVIQGTAPTCQLEPLTPAEFTSSPEPSR